MWLEVVVACCEGRFVESAGCVSGINGFPTVDRNFERPAGCGRSIVQSYPLMSSRVKGPSYLSFSGR